MFELYQIDALYRGFAWSASKLKKRLSKYELKIKSSGRFDNTLAFKPLLSDDEDGIKFGFFVRRAGKDVERILLNQEECRFLLSDIFAFCKTLRENHPLSPININRPMAAMAQELSDKMGRTLKGFDDLKIERGHSSTSVALQIYPMLSEDDKGLFIVTSICCNAVDLRLTEFSNFFEKISDAVIRIATLPK